jgi:hypothetical protein
MLILDAGAFVAAERGDRVVAALIKREWLAGRVPTTCGAVVAQVWRGGRRQAGPAMLLALRRSSRLMRTSAGRPACCLREAVRPTPLTRRSSAVPVMAMTF